MSNLKPLESKPVKVKTQKGDKFYGVSLCMKKLVHIPNGEIIIPISLSRLPKSNDLLRLVFLWRNNIFYGNFQESTPYFGFLTDLGVL